MTVNQHVCAGEEGGWGREAACKTNGKQLSTDLARHVNFSPL